MTVLFHKPWLNKEKKKIPHQLYKKLFFGCIESVLKIKYEVKVG